MEVQPYTVKIPQGAVDDLRERLARTRWPDEIHDTGWDRGADLGFMRDLIEYWQTRFDWRAQERTINGFAQFRATIDGVGIHFIHERGKGPAPIPIVITHGWPGSFVEMLKLIPLLTDPALHGASSHDAFDVVVPSLPGFGFSDRPTQPAMNAFRMADLLATLLDGLGYPRYGAQGGDWGASVSTALGLAWPSKILGIHLNFIPGSYMPYLGGSARGLSDAERSFVSDLDEWAATEGGYWHIQRTRPQTLAYGLNDSPVGLAAWIIEKFRAWSDCAGDVERCFTKDELLTNVSIYWFTQTIRSSCSLYFETRLRPLRFSEGERVTVPCGIAHFPREVPFPPPEWVERGYAVTHWTEMSRGGHFAAMEEPELLAGDIRAFFRALR
jgi:pimeloyl-ACP methyl ester carboxylesterase